MGGPPGLRNIRADFPVPYPYGGDAMTRGRPQLLDELNEQLPRRELEDARMRDLRMGGGRYYEEEFDDERQSFSNACGSRRPPQLPGRGYHDNDGHDDDVFASLRGDGPVRTGGMRWSPPHMREDDFGGDPYGYDSRVPETYGPPLPQCQRPMGQPYPRERDPIPGLIRTVEDEAERMISGGGRFPSQPPQQRGGLEDRFGRRGGDGGRSSYDRQQGGDDVNDDVFRRFFG
ncbi:hypothetical protein LTR36_005871 [Oleoguttula mirabilis]|uniref:Uncharacterized protein n=1 Tax=Oleoguttula mirabilis TaxID=1507867 RepID=A0AAV9JF31_9PEZI|nr:hypothetical protein LTR36_005871 [Oleoguttula mirabilis]